jgi:DNA-binding transcriptional regulator YiaG
MVLGHILTGNYHLNSHRSHVTFVEAPVSTFAVALKDEIRRLARREIKAQTGRTTKAVAQYRREIAALKRRVSEQEKKIAFLEGQERKRVPDAPASMNGSVRFSARSVKAQRRKVGLSADDYAKLIGVSSLTIYNWEHGKSRPRQEQLSSLASIRGIGKREAQARLKLLKASGEKPRKGRGTKRR